MNSHPPHDSTAPIRGVIWLYFWLLLFEGVLRKWVLPGQSDLLLVVRDPVAVLAYGLALRAGVFPFRPAILVLGMIMVLAALATLATDTPLAVLAFGLRTNFLHLPLVFVIPAVMDRRDVIRIGRWSMLMAVPIVLLMIRQFDADPNSPLNAGAGGGMNGQLRGAMGKIRPPGPFSFISGPVVYFGLVAAFVTHGWLESKCYPRVILLLATAATIVAVPVSISRSLLLAILIVLAFGGAVALRNLRNISRLIGPLVVGGCLFAFWADSIYVQAFVTRWDEATSAGSGDFNSNVVERLTNVFTQPFDVVADAPIAGRGLGMGTLAASRLMSGKMSFMLSESELIRLILESGPILGLAFIAWRAWLALLLIVSGWRAANSGGGTLPWLLGGATFLNVLIGQWGQATQLGFAAFGAGLALAALNVPVEAVAPEESGEPEPAPSG